MIQRFLTVASVPELRPDPVHIDPNTPDLELLIPIDVYWEVEETIREIRFARATGLSSQKLWRKFSQLIFPCMVLEKDRLWYLTRVGLD